MDDGNILIIRIHKLLEIHTRSSNVVSCKFRSCVRLMRQNNEFFGQSPINFILNNGANDNELDRVIDYLKSHCFR